MWWQGEEPIVEATAAYEPITVAHQYPPMHDAPRGTSVVRRVTTMMLGGLFGGLLAVPLMFGVGRVAAAALENPGSNAEPLLRLFFGLSGALLAAAIALALAFARRLAGGALNLTGVAVAFVVCGPMFAAFDHLYSASSRGELIAKAALVGGVVGGAASLSLLGALFGAGVFAAFGSRYGIGYDLLVSFASGSEATVWDALRLLGVASLGGAAIGLGMATPLGLLRVPRIAVRPRASFVPLSVLAVLALIGSGTVVAADAAMENSGVSTVLRLADSVAAGVHDDSVDDLGSDESTAESVYAEEDEDTYDASSSTVTTGGIRRCRAPRLQRTRRTSRSTTRRRGL